ncbi:MAG: patatin-like phospholipase family protein [Myxococcales bacterium]|nr:patatin-like phospholipase family protein [Myxococcales bacterium]
MKRALVLGGGGVVGVAWETGLMLGLADAGRSLRDEVDVIVGTSAGGIVGAQLLSGLLRDPRKPTAEGEEGMQEAQKAAAATLDFSKIDPQAMGAVFTIWRAIERTTPELAQKIGEIAAAQNRGGEDVYVERMAASSRVGDWPSTQLRICTVHTGTGLRHVFHRDSGIALGRALAATAAVPGLFPSVTIDGGLHMDGQVHSSTNADVLLEDRPEQVWIAMPSNAHNARSIGRHAQRAVDAEIEALEQAGSRVSFKTPSEADATKLGNNLMDPAAAIPAFEVGLEAGKAWASELD